MAGDKFMPELPLRQPGFTKHENIKKIKKTCDLKHLYKNELDNTYFVHDAAYGNSEDLPKRTIVDKTLNDRAYEITQNVMVIKEEVASMLYVFQ